MPQPPVASCRVKCYLVTLTEVELAYLLAQMGGNSSYQGVRPCKEGDGRLTGNDAIKLMNKLKDLYNEEQSSQPHRS